MAAVYVNNDNQITLPSLTKRKDGSNVTNATVTAQLYQSDRATPVGGPVSMTYVAGTPSEYTGTLPYTTVLTETAQYWCKVVADGAGLHLEEWAVVIAELYMGDAS